jgi:hypothetical protein
MNLFFSNGWLSFWFFSQLFIIKMPSRSTLASFCPPPPFDASLHAIPTRKIEVTGASGDEIVHVYNEVFVSGLITFFNIVLEDLLEWTHHSLVYQCFLLVLFLDNEHDSEIWDLIPQRKVFCEHFAHVCAGNFALSVSVQCLMGVLVVDVDLYHTGCSPLLRALLQKVQKEAHP